MANKREREFTVCGYYAKKIRDIPGLRGRWLVKGLGFDHQFHRENGWANFCGPNYQRYYVRVSLPGTRRITIEPLD